MEEPRLKQVAGNRVAVEVAMRRPGEERRRVVREPGSQRVSHRRRKFVLLDPVPDVEQQQATGCKHPASLRIGVWPVGKNIAPNWQTTTSKAIRN